jgi:hypothetical protein
VAIIRRALEERRVVTFTGRPSPEKPARRALQLVLPELFDQIGALVPPLGGCCHSARRQVTKKHLGKEGLEILALGTRDS